MSTGSTPRLGLVYPNGDDPVSNGDNLIKGIAEKLDPLVPGLKGFVGYNTVTIEVPKVPAVNFDVNIGAYGFTSMPIVSITPRANGYTSFGGRLNAISRASPGNASNLQLVVFAVNTGESMNAGTLSFGMIVVGAVSNRAAAEAASGVPLTGTVTSP